MNEYYKIIECLKKVYAGKNLKEVITKYDQDEKRNKIKNHCYEIIRNYYQINYIIKQITKKANKDILLILQIGIYELTYSVKPDYAVINDLVQITKKINSNLSGFVNAVLRNYIKKKEEFKLEIENNEEIKFNLPQWLINKVKINYPKDSIDILNSLSFLPACGIRINKRKIKTLEYLKILNEKNIEFLLDNQKLVLENYYAVNDIPGFKEGLVSVQDVAAQYLINLLGEYSIYPKSVLDACSAPGGKLCQLLENFEGIEIVALDNSVVRLNKVKENLERLNLKAELILADASNLDWWTGYKYDLVIADVPCSATGTIKRNPDIKINRLESDINKFTKKQREIVINLFNTVKTNGFMVYVTCSILNEENQSNIEWFSNSIVGFKLIKELQIFPSKSSDSLYYALIQKN